MPECLIVDLDGVIRQWGPLTATEVRFGLPAGAVQTAAFEPSLLSAVVTGRISDEQWRQEVSRVISRQYELDGDSVVAEWSASSGSVDERVMDLVREAKRRWRVALLTNATSRLDDDLDRLGLSTAFDAIFNSSELRVAKPDPRVFEIVCERLEAQPPDCLFVDDSPAHVAAAERAGLIGHVFQSPAELEVFLARFA